MCTPQTEEMGQKEIFDPPGLSNGDGEYIPSIVAAIASNASHKQRFSEHETKFHGRT